MWLHLINTPLMRHNQQVLKGARTWLLRPTTAFE
jgi:hypothetical protein